MFSPVVARACAALTNPGAATATWEELSVQLAAQTIATAHARSPLVMNPPASASARVTRAVRLIDRDPAMPLDLGSLASAARLSPYHFLRVFQQLTGETPHQYVRRARLRDAAVRLAVDPERVLDVALGCGFDDVSAFNRAFRAEFGVSPRAYRARR